MTEINTTKLSSKGQIVIPRKIRDSLKLIDGTLFVVEGKNDVISLKKILVPEMKKDGHLNIDIIKSRIIPVLKRNSVTRAGIFGSYARGEQKENSDIDILIAIPLSINLLDFIGLKQELEDVLGKKVDLVEYDTIKPLIKKRVLKEEIRII